MGFVVVSPLARKTLSGFGPQVGKIITANSGGDEKFDKEAMEFRFFTLKPGWHLNCCAWTREV
jgi:hypothetical protein